MTSSVLSDEERAFLTAAPVGHLATVSPDGKPHVVPVCFALVAGGLGISIDEKPKSVSIRELQRVRNITRTPAVSLVVDHYETNWDCLGWVQVHGTATIVEPGESAFQSSAAMALREKYPQYSDQSIADRPMIQIQPIRTVSWGRLDPSVFSQSP